MNWTNHLQLAPNERQTLAEFITDALRRDNQKRGSVMSPSTRQLLEGVLAKLEQVR